MIDVWNATLFDNTLKTWLFALCILVVALALISITKKFILKRIRLWSQKTTTSIDDFVVDVFNASAIPLLYIATFYAAFNVLRVAPMVARIAHAAFLFAITFFVVKIITTLLKRFILSFIKSQDDRETKEKQARGLIIILNIIVVVLAVIFVIDNLGYNVTTLIAGLGIGGIAIALAAQAVLGDLFSYFVIFFDRPFEIGDFISVEDKSGTVEYVGIKTTRIKSLTGEQLVCSNTYLTNARVHNYKRMETRRIQFKVGVTYDTSPTHLKQIPDLVRNIFSNVEGVTLDRVHFSAFGDFSLNFEIVYFVLKPDYNIYMDKQQEINLGMAQAFADAGIEFAFPTQTVILSGANAMSS